jgi:hypothetical protein
MPIAEIQDTELRQRFNHHCVDYERRQGEADGRLRVLENAVTNLATKEDLQKLKTEIVTVLSESIATRTDVDWLKRGFWFAAGGALSAVLTIVAHLAGKI